MSSNEVPHLAQVTIQFLTEFGQLDFRKILKDAGWATPVTYLNGAPLSYLNLSQDGYVQAEMELTQDICTILSGKYEREHINEFVQKHRVLFQRTLERSGHVPSLADSCWDLMRVCFITEFGRLDLRRFLFNGQFPPEPLYPAVLNGVDVSYLNMFQEGDIYSRQMEAEFASDILETILDIENVNKFVEKHKMLFQRAMVQAIHET
jgi:hypothetical protein